MFVQYSFVQQRHQAPVSAEPTAELSPSVVVVLGIGCMLLTVAAAFALG